MKYDEREDREIRSLIRKTAPYDSRKTIKRKYDVTRFVNKFASGLGESDDDILDKYYTPDHRPSRDAMTEMGGFNGIGSLVRPTMITGGIFGALAAVAALALMGSLTGEPGSLSDKVKENWYCLAGGAVMIMMWELVRDITPGLKS